MLPIGLDSIVDVLNVAAVLRLCCGEADIDRYEERYDREILD